MNKFNTYFGQLITDDELNEILGSLKSAIEQFIQDFGFTGVASGGAVVQNTLPNLSVLVGGPTAAYDAAGNRILVPASVNVPLALDENNQPTAVVTNGNEKWLSIFVKFVSTPTDPRLDDAGEQVFFREVAGYQIRVAQGSEAALNTAPRPALRGDQVLLADVKLIANQTAVVNADVSTSRTQNLYDLTGTPLSIKSNNIKSVLQAIVTAINGVNVNSLTTGALTGSPFSVSAGASVQTVLQALLTAINAVYADIPDEVVDAARLPITQTFTGQNTFNAKTTLNETEIRDQLKFVQSDSSKPLIYSQSMPEDDSTPNNKWKHEVDLKFGSTGMSPVYEQQWKMYVGKDGTTYGCAAIVANAVWNKATQKWVPKDDDYEAIALIWSYRRIRVSVVAAGTVDWTDWPADLPVGVPPNIKGLHSTESAVVNVNAHVGGDLFVGDDATIGDMLTVAGKIDANDIDVSGDLKLIGGVIDVPGGSLALAGVDLTIDDLTADEVKGADFRYTAGNVFRQTELNLGLGRPGTNRANWQPCWVYIKGTWQAVWWEYDNQATPGITGFGSEDCPLDIPLLLPHFAVVKKIEVIHYQQDSQANDFNLVQRTTSSWSSAGAPPTDTLYGADGLSGTTGWKKTSIETLLGGGVTINAGSTWFLRCWAGKTGVPNTDYPVGSSNAINASVVSRVRVTWDDIGPRNY